jgi:hypothetical protein
MSRNLSALLVAAVLSGGFAIASAAFAQGGSPASPPSHGQRMMDGNGMMGGQSDTNAQGKGSGDMMEMMGAMNRMAGNCNRMMESANHNPTTNEKPPTQPAPD